MLIARNDPPAVGVPGATGVAGLGMIPSWQFSDDPAVNPKINPHVVYPEGMYQTTVQPVGPYFNSVMDLKGVGLGDAVTALPTWYRVLAIASSAASAYHGYKRNDSIGWAVAWGLLGGLFPIITPAIGFAQGFGKRKKGK